MSLSVRPKVYSLPSYSLTGDLLGFLRCGLQYRYTRIGRLPPSRPVQLWFGEFIHGVLEEAFRRYRETTTSGKPSLPPWPTAEVDDICQLIKARLAARGLQPWSEDLEELGNLRAQAAIQELGPHLLPLIHRAEVRLYGARALPPIPEALQFREADRYEMVGVVDVVTHVELTDPDLQANPVVRAVLDTLPNQPKGKYEIIIDYKGMRRPGSTGRMVKGNLWDQYGWQVQTYAELRRKQADALPVVAGVLLHVNELSPTSSDLQLLKKEIRTGETDIQPGKDSEVAKLLDAWTPGKPLPMLPFDYRLRRALRVVPVTPETVAEALSAFDAVVKRIETCRGQELAGTSIIDAWERRPEDENNCVVCDSRTFCPDYRLKYATSRGEQNGPRLPAFKKK